MKNTKIIIPLLFLFFFSCKKDKMDLLPTGNYIGNIYGHTVKSEDGTHSQNEMNDFNVFYNISEVTDTSITINSRSLYRNKNIIEGVLAFPEGYKYSQYYFGPRIRGEWSKEKGIYYIRGAYNAINTVWWPVSGTFEIKSNF